MVQGFSSEDQQSLERSCNQDEPWEALDEALEALSIPFLLILVTGPFEMHSIQDIIGPCKQEQQRHQP